jgi:hypothetical protein
MLSDGVCRFLQDLHFNLDDKIVLVLAWKFKAQIQGEFSKEEFYNAMIELGLIFSSILFLIIRYNLSFKIVYDFAQLKLYSINIFERTFDSVQKRTLKDRSRTLKTFKER